ncbi:MAG: aldose 1-epimerase family protein [Lentisphaerae bacterium]|nr:aldose 1-epimerase family protein [Lentisphaerota bacterium]
MIEKKSQVVLDNDTGFYVENFVLSSENLPFRSAGNWSITKSRLKGGLSDGIDQVTVNNGHLSFTILTTRGMGLYRGDCGGNFLGWHSPAANPVNPAFINLLEPDSCQGWLKGFNECIVRCGLHSNGANGIDRIRQADGSYEETLLNLHGHIANLPAKYVELQVIYSDPIELVVIGVVEEAACFCPQYRLTTRMSTFVGSSKISIQDQVMNFGAVPAEFQMLYHCNFGRPFLDPGARLVAPSLEAAPRDPRAAEDIDTWDIYKAPEAGYAEQCSYHDFAAASDGSTLSMLRNQAGDKGVTLRWNKNQLPCFCQWKHTASDCEGYVTGMEPATNYPNLKTFERENGRVVNLQPQQVYTIDLDLEVQENSAEVAAIESEISKLLDGRKTLVHPNPIAKWSPVK